MICNSIACRPLYMFLFSICSGWQDRELTRWVHEVFLQSLDYNLLPVYLDVLQVLRAKVHSSLYIVKCVMLAMVYVISCPLKLSLLKSWFF